MSLGFALALGGLGLFIGMLVGTTSIGGVLLVPALVFIWSFDVHAAVATSMASFMLGGLVAALLYSRQGSIDWRAAAWLCGGAMPAAFVGTYAMAVIPTGPLELIVAALIITAGANALRPRRPDARAADRSPSGPLLVLIGGVTGFISALTGTGGPITLLPILLWLRLPVLTAVGLSQAVVFPITLLASVGNFIDGRIDLTAAGVVALALVAGIVVGARAAHAVSSGLLNRLVALVLVTTGALMAGRVLYGWLGA